MATNHVQQAVDDYNKILEQATKTFEDAVSKAEVQLREMLNASSDNEPPETEMVQMDKETYDKLQVQLANVADFIKKHPEIDS